MMKTRTFFRVGNIETNQGLWYDWKGNYTGLIHKEFDFCANHNLPMPYNESLRGWLSATETLDQLWNWFTMEDVRRLQEHGWYAYVYVANRWRDHENHQVIEQESSFPLLRIEISDDYQIKTIKEIESPQRVALTYN